MTTANAKKTVKKPRLKHIVCKPCWELKYCPYGPLVEFFPLVSDELPIRKVKERHAELMNAVRAGDLKEDSQIYGAIEAILCLEPQRWAWISQYRSDELSCSVFGHICPVFLSAEPFTETRENRRVSRAVPRDVMLKVVRRDGQVCNICRKNVADDEIEFDHVIPHSKGGPTTPENLRILCRPCNRRKKDSLKGLFAEDRSSL
jgi:hypothetical protein